MPMDPLAQERPAGNKKIYMYFLIFLVDSRGSGWLGDGHAYLGRGGEKGGGGAGDVFRDNYTFLWDNLDIHSRQRGGNVELVISWRTYAIHSR